MVFSSLIFLFYFLPLTLAVYYVVPQRHLMLRNVVLLLFSLVFYFYGEPKLILVMLSSILINYFFGIIIHKKRSRVILLSCVVINLAVLGFYKYFNFFITVSNEVLHTNYVLLNVVMPIGISFYTFQALSYVIDVYRQEVEPQYNLAKLALYISMFPQLIAGPIVRYKDINALLSARQHTFSEFATGIDRFIFGLSKKVLLSNVFAVIADAVFALPSSKLSFFLAWFGAISYSLQIYFDFSGYSDMAIGLGKMFGFTFMENFNYPYISKSITEFWRRWHISLSTWFRDYVYIPLGGNRCNAVRHVINILVVWTLTGFWHGANYTFLFWGLYFGVLLLIEKLVLKKYLDRLPAAVTHLYALIFIVVGWVIFRSDSFTYAIQYIATMFTPQLYVDRVLMEYIQRYGLYLVLGFIFSTPLFKILAKKKAVVVCMPLITTGLFLLCILSLMSNSYNPFIYFRF